VWLVAFVIFTIGAIAHSRYIERLQREGYTAQARIIQIKVYGAGIFAKSRRRYYPIVSFTDAGGKVMTVMTSQSRRFTVGARVQVLYLPGNPGQAEIVGSEAFSETESTFLAGMSLACAAFAGILLYFPKTRRIMEHPNKGTRFQDWSIADWTVAVFSVGVLLTIVGIFVWNIAYHR
jgi:hypothetical protein